MVVNQLGQTVIAEFKEGSFPELDKALEEQLGVIDSKLIDLIVEYGAQAILCRLGTILQNFESAGNGYYVGKVIEELANVEW